ncbi:unnamed protein product [Closterium sp. Naga37s-1]|nr:unnamed protein product [Closterium sp. Naga37s-1]
MAAEVATSGWVAIGRSKSSKMYPADAAIGNLPPGTLANGVAVGAYHMSGYGLSDVALTSSFELTNTATTTANGRTTITISSTSSAARVAFFRICRICRVESWSLVSQSINPPLSPKSPLPSPPFPTVLFERPLAARSDQSPSAAVAPPACLGPSLPFFFLPFFSNSALSHSFPLHHTHTTTAASSDPFRWERSPSAAAMSPLFPFPVLFSLLSRSFERPLSVGEVPISSGATSVLWAFSDFERPLSVGAVPISSSGATSVLWAFSRSDSQQLDDHGPNE